MKRILLAIVVLVIPFICHAEKILMKSGKSYEGKIKNYQAGTLWFSMDGSVYKLKIDDISSFEIQRTNEDNSYKEKYEALLQEHENTKRELAAAKEDVGTTTPIEAVTEQQDTIKTEQKSKAELTSIDYDQKQILKIFGDLVGNGPLSDGKYTDIKRDHIWETKYKGKRVECIGIIKDIRQHYGSKYYIHAQINKSQYVDLYMAEGEEAILLDLDKEYKIKFQGTLDKLGTGIMFSHEMQDGVIVNYQKPIGKK